jgi:competence protein ComEA
MLRQSVRLFGILVLALAWAVTAGAQMKDTPKTAPKTVAKKVVVDINTASEADLAVLLGVDKTAVKKIIDGRPYRNKRELLTRQLLTTDQYNKVKDLIVAKRPSGK